MYNHPSRRLQVVGGIVLWLRHNVKRIPARKNICICRAHVPMALAAQRWLPPGYTLVRIPAAHGCLRPNAPIRAKVMVMFP